MPFTDPKLRQGSNRSQHPLQERQGLLSCVRLLDVKDFPKLVDRPLPRSQDLPAEYFGVPSSHGDQVVSVSHAWRNQAHPDPTCRKAKLLGRLLTQVTARGSGSADHERPLLDFSTFLFLDFISIPQRPFLPSQQDRTAKEREIFKQALHCMHEMYFYSDRIIHLPWEDAAVPGEGVEETLRAEALLGADFAQLGTKVQMVSQQVASQDGIPPKLPPWFQRRSKGMANLFDQVVSVDDEMVSSSAQLASLLEGNPQYIRVRHYPFGDYSMIPADARGWVFLERFITMVKCAMMDEEAAKHVVVTPSNSILQQIMRGARMLREASLQETTHNRHGELKRVLGTFQEELRSKQFSPASTDKRELAGGTEDSEDCCIVSKIMQEFVEHLSAHWEAEAAEQRSLGDRLIAAMSAAETYLVEWECFSEGYAATLAAGSSATPWPVALLTLLPPVVALVPLLWPYPSPDAGWASQGDFWVVGSLIVTFLCYMLFPIILVRSLALPYSRTMLLLHFAWGAAAAAVTVTASIGVAAGWQIFPVPLLTFVGVACLGPALPLLWWSLPLQQRASRQFRLRLAAMSGALIVVLGLYGVGIPLMNGAIPLVSEGWHPILVSCYLVLKLAFEFLGLKLSRVIGADTMPLFIFGAAFQYEVNVCITFSEVSSWFLVVEQMCFDVLENSYHLYSLLHQDHSDRGGARREQYIISSLMLREFAEVLAPGSFLAMHEVVRAVRRENFALFCNRSEQEVQRTVHFLLSAIAVQIAGSCVIYSILRSLGHEPLRLLRGVIATWFDSFALIACAALVFYCSMQHSHWGMDLSFQFLWVAKPDDAVWHCGLTWAVPPEKVIA